MSRINGSTKGTTSGAPSTINTGTATVDFGSTPGSSEASIAVTGQTTLLSNSKIFAWIIETTTGSNTAVDHKTLELMSKVFIGSITAGVGFTITVMLWHGQAVGTYTVQWQWV